LPPRVPGTVEQIARIGLQVTRFAAEVKRRQDLLDKAEADKDIVTSTAGLEEQVLDTQDLASVGTQFEQNFKARTDEIVSGVKDRITRREVGFARDKRMAIRGAGVRRRALIEQEKRFINAQEERISQSQLEFARNETDLNGRVILADIAERVSELQGANTISAAEADAIKREATGEAIRQRVVELVVQDRFETAEEFLAANKELMEVDTVLRLDSLINNSNRQNNSELRAAARKEIQHGDTNFEVSKTYSPTLKRVQEANLDALAAEMIGMAEDVPKVREVLQLPLDAQRAAVTASRQKGRPLSIREGEFADRLERGVAAFQTLFARSPIDAAQAIGAIAPLEDFDFSKPAGLALQFAEREAAAARVAEKFELPVGSIPMLRKGEEKMIEAMLTQPDANNSVAVLDQMIIGLSAEGAESLANSVVDNRPDLGVAIQAAALDDFALARDILIGQRVLAARDFEFVKAEMRQAQLDVFGAAGEFIPETQQAIVEAGQRVYAVERMKTGDLTFDSTVYKKALIRALGGEFIHAGRRSIPPIPGYTGRDYRDLLQQVGMEQIRSFSADGALPTKVETDGEEIVQVPFELEDMIDTRLIAIGNGLYHLTTGDPLEIVLNELGEIYELDLRALIFAVPSTTPERPLLPSEFRRRQRERIKALNQ
jgi:hypothetical protein